MDFYDRDGKPITSDQYMALTEDRDYRIVKQEYVGPYWVSTVWLGIDHGFLPDGPPLIFETMAFVEDEEAARGHRLHDLDCLRWHTEEEARAGHEEVVTLVLATTTMNAEDLLPDQDSQEKPR